MYVNIWYCVVSLNNLLNFWSEFAHHDEVAQQYIYFFLFIRDPSLGVISVFHKHLQVILSHWCFSLLLMVRLCIMIQCSCLKRCSHAPSVSEMSKRVSGPLLADPSTAPLPSSRVCVRSQSTGRQRAYFSVWRPCSGMERSGAALPCQCHSWEREGNRGWGEGREGGCTPLFQCSYVSPSCVRGTTLHNGGFCLLGGGSGGYSVSIISGSPVFAMWWGFNAFLWLSVVPSLSFYSVFLCF